MLEEFEDAQSYLERFLDSEQEANYVNIVHQMFYCNAKGIKVNGLEKIKDLIANASSVEKFQDPV